MIKGSNHRIDTTVYIGASNGSMLLLAETFAKAKIFPMKSIILKSLKTQIFFFHVWYDLSSRFPKIPNSAFDGIRLQVVVLGAPSAKV